MLISFASFADLRKTEGRDLGTDHKKRSNVINLALFNTHDEDGDVDDDITEGISQSLECSPGKIRGEGQQECASAYTDCKWESHPQPLRRSGNELSSGK